ncbi:radical SAM family heme chaperone HemW [Muricauda sp. SCSIO 64092]|uniref:radical SAM family heme chaperone HemW n=1 Tax=Allomuricauda sp. SCSIO 64092 TaxID=2908842 RepID=UPI001FF1FBC6|nr:radical SAM family heme chaperone HemW [Muricauda sp. SCSIO 64092]UOY08127.1 radical SAM family heme chaperone HemW [Muricauda sp. SCSIO 64092]
MAGIYIHVPFCKQACHYCDFHFSTSLKKKNKMLLALQKELVLRKAELNDESIETIYFGGGTPSILEPHEIEGLLDTVYAHYKVSDNPEVTLEANPDDLPKNQILRLSQTPINRLSIGIQSFFDIDLTLMNRAHNAKEAFVCLEEAMVFFDNISIDLIYGIPGMDEKRWERNMTRALSHGVPHISAYALTVEPRTALEHFIKEGKVPDVDDGQAQRQFHMLVGCLEAKGYINYEISNFGKPGFFSHNNTAYWKGKHYIGIGPSAHSFDGKRRGWNVRNNSKYIKALEENQVPIEHEVLSVRDRYNEYVMTGLRTIWGVSLQKVRKEFGPTYEQYLGQQAAKYIAEHLLFWDGDVLLTTKKGKFLADGIASDLFMVNLS